MVGCSAGEGCRRRHADQRLAGPGSSQSLTRPDWLEIRRPESSYRYRLDPGRRSSGPSGHQGGLKKHTLTHQRRQRLAGCSDGLGHDPPASRERRARRFSHTNVRPCSIDIYATRARDANLGGVAADILHGDAGHSLTSAEAFASVGAAAGQVTTMQRRTALFRRVAVPSSDLCYDRRQTSVLARSVVIVSALTTALPASYGSCSSQDDALRGRRQLRICGRVSPRPRESVM